MLPVGAIAVERLVTIVYPYTLPQAKPTTEIPSVPAKLEHVAAICKANAVCIAAVFVTVTHGQRAAVVGAVPTLHPSARQQCTPRTHGY